MHLGIISDAHHYLDTHGQLYTLEPLARQFEQWAALFDQVTICAPLLRLSPPVECDAYQAANIRILPIADAGGNSVQAKVDLAWKSIGWWMALGRLLAKVNAVHVRCPNNVSILALLALIRSSCLRHAIYTGSWNGYAGEPNTYRWQRWFLKEHFKGPVAVYGTWPNQPSHIIPSFSPSLHLQDWEMESAQIADRLESLGSSNWLPSPVRLVTVGSLNRNKNQQLVLQAMRCLLEQGVDCELDVLGEGDQRAALEQQAVTLGLARRVQFHGRIAHSAVRQCYRQATFLIQAPFAEGYGKAPIEAFFHGVIPILSDVDMSLQIVGGNERGRCFPQGDAQAIALHISELGRQPAEMARLIRSGREYARELTMEAWQKHLRELLNHHWKTQLKADPTTTRGQMPPGTQ